MWAVLQGSVNNANYHSNAVLKEWFWISNYSALAVWDTSHCLTTYFHLSVHLPYFIFRWLPLLVGNFWIWNNIASLRDWSCKKSEKVNLGFILKRTGNFNSGTSQHITKEFLNRVDTWWHFIATSLENLTGCLTGPQKESLILLYHGILCLQVRSII